MKTSSRMTKTTTDTENPKRITEIETNMVDNADLRDPTITSQMRVETNKEDHPEATRDTMTAMAAKGTNGTSNPSLTGAMMTST